MGGITVPFALGALLLVSVELAIVFSAFFVPIVGSKIVRVLAFKECQNGSEKITASARGGAALF
jgi:hypothetical protein